MSETRVKLEPVFNNIYISRYRNTKTGNIVKIKEEIPTHCKESNSISTKEINKEYKLISKTFKADKDGNISMKNYFEGMQALKKQGYSIITPNYTSNKENVNKKIIGYLNSKNKCIGNKTYTNFIDGTKKITKILFPILRKYNI